MILTFTDFGSEGPYLGQMRQAALQVNPTAQIIDLMFDVPAYDIEAAALLLNALVSTSAPNHTYLCVVDPGVGSVRRPICIEANGCFFVGPDNGLFTQIMNESDQFKAYEIIWRPGYLSNSFHGRDLFAPVAARLEHGDLSDLKETDPDALIRLKVNQDRIIYTDRYGNCWTGRSANDVNKTSCFEISGLLLKYAEVFSSVPIGSAFWYINSSGLVEFALNQQNLSNTFKINIGDTFQLSDLTD